jgi:hypothetical protein
MEELTRSIKMFIGKTLKKMIVWDIGVFREIILKWGLGK